MCRHTGNQGLASYATRVLAVEGGTAVLEINGQTVRLPWLNARPGKNVRLRVDTGIA